MVLSHVWAIGQRASRDTALNIALSGEGNSTALPVTNLNREVVN